MSVMCNLIKCCFIQRCREKLGAGKNTCLLQQFFRLKIMLWAVSYCTFINATTAFTFYSYFVPICYCIVTKFPPVLNPSYIPVIIESTSRCVHVCILLGLTNLLFFSCCSESRFIQPFTGPVKWSARWTGQDIEREQGSKRKTPDK